MFYAPHQITDLQQGANEVEGTFRALRQRFIGTPFRSAIAREHSDHGFCRRLGTMARCIARLYELLPPDLQEVPDDGVTTDAALYVQAFVFNTFGCCENLAWIWVHERDVRDGGGRALRPARIGLGPGCDEIRGSFSPALRQEIEGYDPWFAYLKDYRDALAHRIPLYIPPFSIDPDQGERWRELDRAANQALLASDLDDYELLCAERDGLRHFTPVISHSLTEARPIVLHPQLLADFETIVALGQALIDELVRLAPDSGFP